MKNNKAKEMRQCIRGWGGDIVVPMRSRMLSPHLEKLSIYTHKGCAWTMGAVLVTVSVYGYKRQKDRMEILTVKPCVRWRYLCEVRAGGNCLPKVRGKTDVIHIILSETAFGSSFLATSFMTVVSLHPTNTMRSYSIMQVSLKIQI